MPSKPIVAVRRRAIEGQPLVFSPFGRPGGRRFSFRTRYAGLYLCFIGIATSLWKRSMP